MKRERNQKGEDFNRGDKPVNTGQIEGRNAVIEAFRAGRTIDKVYILDGCHDGPVETIRRGKVRRAKLYYLRDRVGKAAKVKGLIN